MAPLDQLAGGVLRADPLSAFMVVVIGAIACSHPASRPGTCPPR
jgi:hypothetical protein